MADTNTTNFNLVKPEVGASDDTWGTKWNANADAIDTQMKVNADAVAAVASDLAAYDAATKTLTNKTIDIANNTLTGVAPLASPALSGTPTAPTAATGTNTTQVATTAFVHAERTNTATLTNKTLTSPTVNTPTVSGGTINNTVIGGTTPAAGSFTTVSASTSVTTPLVTRAGTLALSATGANVITASTNGVERMRIDSAGNVGIGTSSPASRMHISPANASGDQGVVSLTLGNESNSARGSRIVKDTSTPYALKFISALNPSAGAATIFEHFPGAESMRIDAVGNVGIGTNNPAQQLHITGNFRIGSAVHETPSGSAPLYSARAWVNFDGVGGVTIWASRNVSSVTRNATGDYTVNFATAMPTARYVVAGMSSADTGFGDTGAVAFRVRQSTAPTTTAVRITNSAGSSSIVDAIYANVVIFR